MGGNLIFWTFPSVFIVSSSQEEGSWLVWLVTYKGEIEQAVPAGHRHSLPFPDVLVEFWPLAELAVAQLCLWSLRAQVWTRNLVPELKPFVSRHICLLPLPCLLLKLAPATIFVEDVIKWSIPTTPHGRQGFNGKAMDGCGFRGVKEEATEGFLSKDAQ